MHPSPHKKSLICTAGKPSSPEEPMGDSPAGLSSCWRHSYLGTDTLKCVLLPLSPSFLPSFFPVNIMSTPNSGHFSSCIIFLFLCNKLPQAQLFKPTQIYYLTISAGFLPKVEIKVSDGAVVPSKAWGFLPRSHVVDRIQFLDPGSPLSSWLVTRGCSDCLKAACHPLPCDPLHNEAMCYLRPGGESLFRTTLTFLNKGLN